MKHFLTIISLCLLAFTAVLAEENLRYTKAFGLEEAGNSPFKLFQEWQTKATAGGVIAPEVAILSTLSLNNGVPNLHSRALGFYLSPDQKSFLFYTNSNSQKILELKETPQASLCFVWWMNPLRQVSVEGSVVLVDGNPNNQNYAIKLNENSVNVPCQTYAFIPKHFCFTFIQALGSGNFGVAERVVFQEEDANWTKTELTPYISAGRKMIKQEGLVSN